MEMHINISIILVISGIINVLLIRWADKTYSISSDGKSRTFQHPMIQTFVMFLGYSLCLGVFKIIYLILKRKNNGSENEHFLCAGNREFSPIVFIVPALIDLIASVLAFSGFYLSFSTSYILIRGSALIFVNIFSSNYLNRTLNKFHWIGFSVILFGIFLVIYSDMNYMTNSNFNHSKVYYLTGDLLIIISAIIFSIGTVYEEKIIKTIMISELQATGWIGIFGLVQSILIIIPLNFIKIYYPFNNNSNEVIDDIQDGFSQLKNNPVLILIHLGFMISIMFYKYTSIVIIKNLSSIGLILFDSLRLIPICFAVWVFEWEYFSFLQLFGFFTLLTGTLIYWNIAIFNTFIFRMLTRNRSNVEEEIISNQPADRIEA